MDAHKFIFIGGMHRSGTTLLAKLMGEHESISSFQNTGAPMNEGQHLQNVYPDPINYGTVGLFGFNEKAYLNEKSDLITQENKEKLFQQWSRYWDLSKPYLLEKSPPNIIRTRFLQEMFPESCFIIIKRHPIAVSFATQKFSRRQLELNKLFNHWVICHKQLEKDLPFINNVIVINYEDLVSNPQKVLDTIADLLSISKFRITNKINPSTNQKYFNRWHNLPSVERKLIFDNYQEDILDLGYSLEV
ncbi:hypothetical protein ES708_26691 [subsurface metagenome]